MARSSHVWCAANTVWTWVILITVLPIVGCCILLCLAAYCCCRYRRIRRESERAQGREQSSTPPTWATNGGRVDATSAHVPVAVVLSCDSAAAGDALAKVEGAGHDEATHANAMLAEVVPQMNAVRATASGLEKEIDDDLWPIPKYRELMFIR